MHAEWKRLRKPATVGFLLGLVLTAGLAYLAPASDGSVVAGQKGN